MKQRTCNIIMCCKGHCNLDGADGTMMGDIAAYMSHECGCPKEDYNRWLMGQVLRDALFDYIDGANSPGSELRQLLYQYATKEPGISARICTLFQLVHVRNGDCYVNGFSSDLIKQSQIDLREQKAE